MTTDLKGLETKLERLADDITGHGLRQSLDQTATVGIRIADDSVRAALGDMSFSHWRPGAPIQIRTAADRNLAGSITFKPAAGAAGAATVLNDGRHTGQHGHTAGRGTWNQAQHRMETELPRPVEEHVQTSLRQHFGG